jgi:antitoxin (DNA-binding transcriptional repressor) of toxin-antitoxin stability system
MPPKPSFSMRSAMQNIDINQVKQQLPQILEDIEDAIIITKQGLPIAKIVGISNKKKKRQFGSARGLIKISDDFDAPLDDFKDYM